MNRPIKRVAIIGTGVIGASWAALFLAKGLKVAATDPAPGAENTLRQFVDNAWPALEQLGLAPSALRSNLTFTTDLPTCVADADLVQENGPERIDFKRNLYRQLDELLLPDVIIASSSSGLTMSEIQTGCQLHPERCVIGHPFNPPHLIPLVEIVGGAKTSEDTIERAAQFYTSIGKRTVRLHKELSGHVANRLQAAVMREVYYLVGEGVLSVADVDTALCWGPGLRWGIMGQVLLNHLGGGEGGMGHFLDQFAGPLTAWWKALGSPELTPELRQKLIDGVNGRSGIALDPRTCRRARQDTARAPRSACRNGGETGVGRMLSASNSGRLFFLDLGGGRVLSVNPDGSDLKTIISEGRKLPDGLVVDEAAGHLYWTNMGNFKENDGSILRSDLHGRNITTIVPPGGSFTPKQLQLDKRNGKLYWSDREGMRVMRANLDGSQIETLVDTSLGDPRPGPDARKWCVGIAVDVAGGKFYWTQKGSDDAGEGRIFRANIELPPDQTPANRQDIDLLYDNLPEPIDLDLDVANRLIYWTDRGDPPRGNTVNRAPMDPTPGQRKDPEIVFSHLMEGIGLALDLKGRRMFVTDLAGSVYTANLDGSNKKLLLFAEGNLTGIAYAELP